MTPPTVWWRRSRSQLARRWRGLRARAAHPAVSLVLQAGALVALLGACTLLLAPQLGQTGVYLCLVGLVATLAGLVTLLSGGTL